MRLPAPSLGVALGDRAFPDCCPFRIVAARPTTSTSIGGGRVRTPAAEAGESAQGRGAGFQVHGYRVRDDTWEALIIRPADQLESWQAATQYGVRSYGPDTEVLHGPDFPPSWGFAILDRLPVGLEPAIRPRTPGG